MVKKLIAAIAFFLLLSTTSLAKETVNVDVTITGVKSNKGTVGAALCISLSKAGCIYQSKKPAKIGNMTFRFKVPPGSYAIGGHHDVNSNSKFDKLTEFYALSGPCVKIMPKFGKVALKIEKDISISIKLKRLLSC